MLNLCISLGEEQDFPNRFVETTTAANRVFHLEGLFILKRICVSLIESYLGFSADNVPSDTQQRNNQFGFVQARPWQNNQVFQSTSILLSPSSRLFIDIDQEDQFRDTTNEFNRPNLPMEPQLGIILSIKSS